MARKPRVEFPEAVYHIMARGNERARIFTDPEDVRMFLEVLDLGLERFHAVVHAYCLMPNHYHLALQTHEPTLSRLMGWVQTTFTVRYNLRHRRVGHLFQGRYRAELVNADDYAMILARYIHLNPVRARRGGKMIYKGSVAQLNDYAWSSHQAWCGMGKPSLKALSSEWLHYWGPSAAVARRAYRRDMEREMVEENSQDWKECVEGGFIAGDEQFQKKVAQLLTAKKDHLSESWRTQEQGTRRAGVARKLLETEKDVRWKMWLRVEGLGETKVAVARDMNYRDGGSVLQVLKRLEIRCQKEKDWKKKRDTYRTLLSRIED